MSNAISPQPQPTLAMQADAAWDPRDTDTDEARDARLLADTLDAEAHVMFWSGWADESDTPPF